MIWSDPHMRVKVYGNTFFIACSSDFQIMTLLMGSALRQACADRQVAATASDLSPSIETKVGGNFSDDGQSQMEPST